MSRTLRGWARVGAALSAVGAVAVAAWIPTHDHRFGEQVTHPSQVAGEWVALDVLGERRSDSPVLVGRDGELWRFRANDGCNDIYGRLAIGSDGRLAVRVTSRGQHVACHGWGYVPNVEALEEAETIWVDGWRVRLVNQAGHPVATYWRNPG